MMWIWESWLGKVGSSSAQGSLFILTWLKLLQIVCCLHFTSHTHAALLMCSHIVSWHRQILHTRTTKGNLCRGNVGFSCIIQFIFVCEIHQSNVQEQAHCLWSGMLGKDCNAINSIKWANKQINKNINAYIHALIYVPVFKWSFFLFISCIIFTVWA